MAALRRSSQHEKRYAMLVKTLGEDAEAALEDAALAADEEQMAAIAKALIEFTSGAGPQKGRVAFDDEESGTKAAAATTFGEPALSDSLVTQLCSSALAAAFKESGVDNSVLVTCQPGPLLAFVTRVTPATDLTSAAARMALDDSGGVSVSSPEFRLATMVLRRTPEEPHLEESRDEAAELTTALVARLTSADENEAFFASLTGVADTAWLSVLVERFCSSGRRKQVELISPFLQMNGKKVFPRPLFSSESWKTFSLVFIQGKGTNLASSSSLIK